MHTHLYKLGSTSVIVTLLPVVLYFSDVGVVHSPDLDVLKLRNTTRDPDPPLRALSPSSPSLSPLTDFTFLLVPPQSSRMTALGIPWFYVVVLQFCCT